jgi:hypothetical protein
VSLRRWLVDRIVEYLTEPLGDYERRVRNDLGAILAGLRKADVVLVEGDQRVSAIIRYLTQSCWSHSAIYIGDELIARGGERAAWARDTFGDDADHLLVEALPHGVVVAPVAKYVDYNIRICRPHRLRPEHARIIMDDAVAAIGWRYDLRNVFDLARYLIPVTVVPPRWRSAALHFGSGDATEVICSSLIARLFHKVRFPILPTVTYPDGEPSAPRTPLGRRIFGQPSARYTGIFRMRHPTLITPRDFDLSPFFDVIKPNPVARGSFDYSRIHWDDERGPDSGDREAG